ncbi:MAG TPA: hypothetical protein VF014_08210 [Casimicrobiaceae bacterium]|nr:hypothetical protein [Casimicrobiaceae bacterium]
MPTWGRPEEPAVTEADADEFQSRQTHRLGALKSEYVADHPFAVEGRAHEGLPEEETNDA